MARHVFDLTDSSGIWKTEAVFLVQPWVQARSAADYCKLCYQERLTKDHLECKRAHLTAYNSLLAIMRLEKGAEFEEAFKRLSEAREKCVSTPQPDDHCHNKSQEALQHAMQLYDKILEDYKKRIPNRPSTTPRM